MLSAQRFAEERGPEKAKTIKVNSPFESVIGKIVGEQLGYHIVPVSRNIPRNNIKVAPKIAKDD